MDKLAVERESTAESDQQRPPDISTVPPAAANRAATTPSAFMAQPGRAAAAPAPVYRRAWFWVAVSAAVAGGVVAAYALSQNDPRSSLHPIDTR
jgi:hypothetical protein